jgi:tetratricopeptide (TPR) repeat protein
VALGDALAEFERLRAARERELARREDIDGRVREVVQLLGADDCATAEPLLRQLLAEPDVVAGGHQATRVLGDLARCRQQAGDLEEARSLLERALARRPDSFLAHFELGTLLAQQGRAVAAVPHLLAAARANPFDYAVHVNLGLCFGMLGRLNEALGELRRAVAIQPEETRTRQLLLDLEWAVGNRVQAEALVHLGGVDAPPGMPGAPEAGGAPRDAKDWAR